ncbi:MAG: hypothetical protein NTZ05_01570, partial [Chloroflexi bacterium]|nr:hypothetical protein [Chloroflexota bacterium]
MRHRKGVTFLEGALLAAAVLGVGQAYSAVGTTAGVGSAVSGPGEPVRVAGAAQPAATRADGSPAGAIDLTRLPVGDGRIASEPHQGSVWPCNTTFGGGGSTTNGPWVNSDGTFDLTAKAVVDGEVSWPHSFTITLDGAERRVSGNNLPSHTTGTYPVARGDDAAAYDP